ncbi:MAG: hypothetical protein HGA55_05745 [Methanoregulaceae archaeon]|nr:hypothetical protein [Methanoregulaceae archaeon]
MTESRLFLFVEGNDDRRFFSRIVAPLFRETYASIEIIGYASMKTERVCRFVRSIREMGHDFLLFADIDEVRNVHAKKAVLRERYCTLSDERIVVIIKEIESWYLAGLDDRAQKRLHIRHFQTTNHITKEIFNAMIPPEFSSRIAFMVELLNRYSLREAEGRNRSFLYFMTHYHLESSKRGHH